MLNIDKVLKEIDYALEILEKGTCDSDLETGLDVSDKKQSERVMRVNHMGEICAQALYRGQAVTTDDEYTKKIIQKMCGEERKHLEMCNERLHELSGRTSYFNAIWYVSSFMLGAFVGKLDRNKSLGFIYETENQVEKHLDEYTDKLPEKDARSKKILDKIKQDETKHKNTAKDLGSVSLSKTTKKLMSASSGIMKKISFYV